VPNLPVWATADATALPISSMFIFYIQGRD
jgi:hypothetical protein